MKNVTIGQKVFVPASANSVWTGEGVVERLLSDEMAILRMTTGRLTGRSGGFMLSVLEPVNSMKIISVKRSTQGTGLKVYGEVLGESGKTYKFAYFRRANFRGWICSCESFFFDMFKKNRNCKHLRFVRGQVGRFGASVQ